MRWILGAIALASLALVIWLFGLGGMADVSRWATAGQREAQTALAAALRSLRAGEAGAWFALMSVCAAYGFFHAAGPGHGKLVIGGYGAASQVPLARLIGLAVASSLAQAMTAIVLVALGALVFGWGRAAMTQAAETVLAPASYAAISLLGVWLVWRGFRHLRNLSPTSEHAHDQSHAHDHSHDHGEVCSSCGHAHGPSLEQAQSVQSLYDALGVVAAVAIRPCTGAVFLLILCFGFGIPWAGVAGALVMGLGTASLTALVALAAVSLRESALAPLQGRTVAVAMACAELFVGACVAMIAAGIVWRMVG